MEAMIGAATSTYETTTGFSFAATVSWVGDHLIKFFIGSGIGVLDALKGWIVALAVIGLIVYFSFRAWKFFRA